MWRASTEPPWGSRRPEYLAASVERTYSEATRHRRALGETAVAAYRVLSGDRSVRRLLPEEDACVTPCLAGSQRFGPCAIEMHEHRLLVTGEALRAHRTLGGALLR